MMALRKKFLINACGSVFHLSNASFILHPFSLILSAFSQREALPYQGNLE
jgi:hypothetical protein